jgi:hypothetical protein
MHPLLRFGLWLGGFLVAGKVVERIMFARRKVFVSFDYENDKHYKFLLEAWNANRSFDFQFNDASSGEIRTSDVARVKGALTTKIRDADVVLAIVGREANKAHRDRFEIGYRNWMNFEIAQGKLANKRMIAVMIDRSYELPEQLAGANPSWAMSFSEDAITMALKQA